MTGWFRGTRPDGLVSWLLAGLAAWAPQASAFEIGCGLGFVVLLPLGFLSPWAAARGLVARTDPRTAPVPATLYGWASLFLRPLRVLKGTVLNLVLLAGVGYPLFTYLDQPGTSFWAWPAFWSGLLVLGAVHVQHELGSMAQAEDRPSDGV